MSSPTPRARLLIIGIAWLAGAAVLAWFSAVATMRLERPAADPAPLAQVERTTGADAPVTITIGSKLFGLIDVDQQRIDGVRSVSLISSRAPGSNSRTPDHMVFDTAIGPVNIGRPQQLFARDFEEIKTFFEDRAQRDATLSSIGRSSELRRFIVAQLFVVFLGFVGLALLWLGIKPSG